MSPLVGPLLAALATLAGVRALRLGLTRPADLGAVLARLSGGRRRPAALDALAARLARAGVAAPPAVALGLVGAMAAGAGGLAWAALRHPVPAVLAACAVVAAAGMVLASADRRHLDRVAAQLPGVAQQLGAALGAGLSLRQALTRAARDAPEPAAAELRRVSAELALGARVEDALESLLARLPHPDLRLMVTAVLVQRRAGGDLARALADLAARLDERGRLARELRGATAQARATAWMVAALPVVGGAVVELASPGTLARTLGRGPGLIILVVSLGLQGLGIALVRRLSRVDP